MKVNDISFILKSKLQKLNLLSLRYSFCTEFQLRNCYLTKLRIRAKEILRRIALILKWWPLQSLPLLKIVKNCENLT